MVQVVTINGVRGYLLSSRDLEIMQSIQRDGKTYDFIPIGVPKKVVDMSRRIIELALEGNTKDEVVEITGKTSSWINKMLYQKYGTTSFKVLNKMHDEGKLLF